MTVNGKALPVRRAEWDSVTSLYSSEMVVSESTSSQELPAYRALSCQVGVKPVTKEAFWKSLW
jgi:hypothetical protein